MTDNQLAGRRILVVEDDYFLAAEMTAMLQEAGAQVLGPAGNVADALETLQQHPELAVLDLGLGDELSLPVAEELERRGVPFIFATGSMSDMPSQHGALAICSKPTDHAKVRRTLVEALGG